MKTVVIMESPTKCKTVEQYLGSGYKVISSNGHISALKKTGALRLGIDLETYTPQYRIAKEQKELFLKLKKATDKASKVILATDPDREGEAIAYHLNNFLDIQNKSTRVRFHEITKSEILSSFNQEKAINYNLVRAQEVRRMLDRMIGFRLSFLLQNKIKMRSAGRVQSVALKLIIERENVRKAFKPEEYWTIRANAQDVIFSLSKFNNKKLTIHNQAEVEAIANQLQPNFKIIAISSKQKFQKAFKPYRTSTLMQDAANLLNFSASQTAFLAQKLYEGCMIDNTLKSLITYPRTDSIRISSRFSQEAQKYITKKHGAAYVNKNISFVNKSELVQDAHEAIRITHLKYCPADLKSILPLKEWKLYQLIWNRSLGSLMSDAEFRHHKIILDNANYQFQATSRECVFQGFLKYANSEFQNQTLKTIGKLDSTVTIPAIEATQSFSNPPYRYSIAKLIETLEELGIGRPSTYGLIINILTKRNYVQIINKSIVPQASGFLVHDFLQKGFSDIINEQYTADVEQKLNAVAAGKMKHTDILERFWPSFEKQVEELLVSVPALPVEKVNKNCPKCNHDLVYRNGRYGKFIGCSNFPKCRYIENLIQATEPCPKCKSGLVTLKYGPRQKPFWGCSLYRETKCDYVKPYSAQKKPLAPTKKSPKENKTIKLTL